MITLVECFGKLDYLADEDISCVVDFGSNIGVSAGYFLTRNNIGCHSITQFLREYNKTHPESEPESDTECNPECNPDDNPKKISFLVTTDYIVIVTSNW